MEPDDERLALRAGRCRCRSAEPARLAFGGKALDCELVSLSPEGAQVCLRSLADVPGGLVTLRLPGGGTRAMRCAWQNGWHVGLVAAEPGPAASRAAPAGVRHGAQPRAGRARRDAVRGGRADAGGRVPVTNG